MVETEFQMFVNSKTMRKIIICLTIMCFLTNTVFAQEETIPLETQLNNLLHDLNSFSESLIHKKARQPRSTARKLRSIERKIDKAVKTIPPSSCLEKLKSPMNDFYKLTSEIGTGIACGPPIIPTFFDRKSPDPITIDCLPPPDEPLRAQLSDLFSEVYGLYNTARDLVRTDINTNEIPDICE